RLGKREIPVAGDDFQPSAMDAHLDAAIVSGRRGTGAVAEGVLVARLACDLGIGALDGVTVEFWKDLAAGRGSVFGKDVAGAGERNVDLLEVPVSWNS